MQELQIFVTQGHVTKLHFQICIHSCNALLAYVHNACIEIYIYFFKLHGWFKCYYYQTWSEPAGTEVDTHVCTVIKKSDMGQFCLIYECSLVMP